MKRDKKIWYWILCLIFFEALLFLYCNQVNPNLFMFEAFFLILGIAAVCFLTEILITWLIILSFALSIFVLVSGVVYLPLNDLFHLFRLKKSRLVTLITIYWGIKNLFKHF